MSSIDGTLVPELSELTRGPEAVPLWTVLEGMLQGESESSFVKSVIGDDLLKEITVAREELFSLLDILSSMRDGRDDADSRPSTMPRPPGLAAGTSLLQQRLKLLLEGVREPEVALPTQREKMVAQYILNGSKRPPSAAGGGSRPGSRLSQSRGSARPASSASSRSSGSSYADPMAELKPLQRSLRFDAVHEIQSELRELFTTEKEQLLEDIDFVRTAIEGEMHWTRFDEPNSKELTEMTASLQRKADDESHAARLMALPGSASLGDFGAATVLGETTASPSPPRQERVTSNLRPLSHQPASPPSPPPPAVQSLAGKTPLAPMPKRHRALPTLGGVGTTTSLKGTTAPSVPLQQAAPPPSRRLGM